MTAVRPIATVVDIVFGGGRQLAWSFGFPIIAGKAGDTHGNGMTLVHNLPRWIGAGGRAARICSHSNTVRLAGTTFPQREYRVTNWPAHEARLGRQWEVTFWLGAADLARSRAPWRTTPGGRGRHPPSAAEAHILSLVIRSACA